MSSGWIKVHRQISDCELWFAEPFSRGQAWIDLILLANHKNKYFYKRGIKISVERGDVAYSIKALSDRWQWSRGKAKRFLDDLEDEQQIEQLKNNVTTVVRLINYDKYQQSEEETDSKQSSKWTTNGQQTEQQIGKQTDTNKNDKNYKNKKNEKNDKKITVDDSKESSGIHNHLISVFTGFYEKEKSIKYAFSGGKDGTAMKQIIIKINDLWKHKHGSDADEEGLKKSFDWLLNQTKKDSWVFDNLSLANINSKFNEIIQKKESNGHSKDNMAGMRGYLEGLASGKY